MGVSDKIQSFIVSAFIVVLVIIAACVAFCMACIAIIIKLS